jgi:LytS/YehU family sensor histidine kinase
MRFRDRLDVSVEVDPAVRTADVPSFLLQPLAENAIKHGMRGKSGRGAIRIHASSEGKRLIVRIEDNGPGIPSTTTAGSRAAGIGLRNTRQRLETLYPGNHVFEITNTPLAGALVTIQIPLTYEAEKAGEPGRAARGARRLWPVPAESDAEPVAASENAPARRLSDR